MSPRPALIALLCLIAAYVLGGWALSFALGVSDKFSFLLYSGAVFKVTFMLLSLFIGWRAWNVMVHERPARLTRALAADIRTRLFTCERMAAALPIFIAFIFFMSAFTNIKAMIPLVYGYNWDAAFADIDRLIHFGTDPWRLLQPILGYPWITSFLNIVYNLWFVVMFGVLYWQLFDLRKPGLRMRFFWTFFATWMLNGSVLAIFFASAGPCFYGLVAPAPDPYADQLSYLSSLAKDYPVWAVATQQALWDGYKSSTIGLGSGISAMPSVHVAMAMLFALIGWHYGRASRVFFTAFFVCILLGSVHLAWHYALDGYVGAAVTLLIWWVLGLFFADKTPKTQILS